MFGKDWTSQEIFYSQYIVSWKKMGGKIYRGGLFERWLREVCQLTDQEVRDILNMADNGKLELESLAKKFINEHMEDHLKEKEMAECGDNYLGECTGTHYKHLKDEYDRFVKKHKH